MVEPNSSATQLAHTWLALATLPWMATEVNLMDLKLANARQFTNWSAKLKWNEGKIKEVTLVKGMSVVVQSHTEVWYCTFLNPR